MISCTHPVNNVVNTDCSAMITMLLQHCSTINTACFNLLSRFSSNNDNKQQTNVFYQYCFLLFQQLWTTYRYSIYVVCCGRQSRDRNRNKKTSVYCQYRVVKSNVSSIGHSSERNSIVSSMKRNSIVSSMLVNNIVRWTTLFSHDNCVVMALFNQQCCNNLCYFYLCNCIS